MKARHISDNVVRRLPRYLRKLDELAAKGETRISSKSLGEAMGLTSSQIRQDLNCFGCFGLQGYGYDVATLREEIENILGVNRKFTAVLVGVGRIGQALTEHFSFFYSGVRLIAAFDIHPDLIGLDIGNMKIRSVKELAQFQDKFHPNIAILCVPRDIANETAIELVNHGIRGIWNFTNVELTTKDDNVVVENLHFTDSLLTLNYYIKDSLEAWE